MSLIYVCICRIRPNLSLTVVFKDSDVPAEIVFLLCMGEVLAWCPSCCHHRFKWVAAGVEPRFAGCESIKPLVTAASYMRRIFLKYFIFYLFFSKVRLHIHTYLQVDICVGQMQIFMNSVMPPISTVASVLECGVTPDFYCFYLCECSRTTCPAAATERCMIDVCVWRCEGIDHLLAQHIAHLFIRDPVSMFREKIDLDDTVDTDHFEVSLIHFTLSSVIVRFALTGISRSPLTPLVTPLCLSLTWM